MTPFEVVYGCPPLTLLRFIDGETKVEVVAQELKDRDEALRQLKYNLKRAQDYMKAQADKKQTEIHFEVGEWVFPRLRPHRQNSAIQRIQQKLAPKFYGPYKIVEKICPLSYKL